MKKKRKAFTLILILGIGTIAMAAVVQLRGNNYISDNAIDGIICLKGEEAYTGQGRYELDCSTCSYRWIKNITGHGTCFHVIQ